MMGGIRGATWCCVTASAWFETLPSVALTMTRILGCNTFCHGEERALRARLEPRTLQP